MAKKTKTKKNPKVSEEMINATRIIEASIFAATEPMDKKTLSMLLPKKLTKQLDDILAKITQHYQSRGINLIDNKNGFYFRTAPDLAPHLTRFRTAIKKLSRAAMETLAIIAYHQPITRAEIETIRGVAMSRGTLDILLETGWIKFKGRRKTIGNPVTLGTSEKFLVDFDLKDLKDLPGIEELKDMGLLQLGRDLSTIGMGEEDAPLKDGEQPDLWAGNAMDDIINDPQEPSELLMDEPLDDEPMKPSPKKKKIAPIEKSLADILSSPKK